MPLHTTSIIEERAASVADKEAEKVWQKKGNYKEWTAVWEEIYKSALREFAEQAACCA